MIPEIHNLYEKVQYTLDKIYYSEIICFYCEGKDGLLESSDNLKKNCIIYPFC